MKRSGRVIKGALLAAVLAGAGSAAFAEDIEEEIAILERRQAVEPNAILRGVDKITARVSEFEAPINVPVQYGTLTIIARKCNKRPPTETPEVSVFLEITDYPPQSDPSKVFSGWMFASSPGLSALEHAVYDVWVVDCRAPENES